MLGTLGYIAPELLSGDKASQQSDIFSLGVMLVEALTGQQPFQGFSVGELLSATINSTFHLQGNAKAVRDLDDLIQKCLAKRPQDRFANVGEIQKELIPALRNCPMLITSKTPEVSTDSQTK